MFVELRYFWLDLCYEIKSCVEKIKRFVWNRGIKLQWNRLWVRKDEFHDSLNTDVNAMFEMSRKERIAYIEDLYKRRQIAHERDLINE